MFRVRRLPGLLAGALAVLIAWLERRDPARPGSERSRGGAAADAAVPEGAVAGDGTTECPDSHPIKGNATSMIYHEPGRAAYARTIPNFCFATAEAAEAAGYRAPQR
jgi:hypothetical protein